MTNAHTARAWLLGGAGRGCGRQALRRASRPTPRRSRGFGIDTANMFEFWDWVGGRYSLWSRDRPADRAARSACDRFEELLAGAHAMDEHFRTAPLERNLPVHPGAARRLVQQLPRRPDATRSCPTTSTCTASPPTSSRATWRATASASTATGSASTTQTGPVIWGEPGTNGQHAFYQLIHQGTELIPCDFIAAGRRRQTPLGRPPADAARQLLRADRGAGVGKTAAEARAELETAGLPGEALETLAAAQGVRPATGRPPRSCTRSSRPDRLGSLIALYEHKIFVQGVIWDINSFDQWGVELGKQLAEQDPARAGGRRAGHQPRRSTNGLINHFKQLRGTIGG